MRKGDAVQLLVPLPPPSLRANSRAHWSRKKRDADDYSRLVFIESTQQYAFDGKPLKRADVHYEWRYSGTEPDHSNLGGHTKYLQDILCCGPKLNPKQGYYKRYHLGIVDNDKYIHATFEAVKVPHKINEGVLVTLTEAR